MRIMPFMKRKKGVQFAGIGIDSGGGDTSALANKTDLTAIILTGTTNTSGNVISAGAWFYLNGTPCVAKVDIASGATFTEGTNYEEKTVGSALTELNSKIPSGGGDLSYSYISLYPYLNTSGLSSYFWTNRMTTSHIYAHKYGRIVFLTYSLPLKSDPIPGDTRVKLFQDTLDGEILFRKLKLTQQNAVYDYPVPWRYTMYANIQEATDHESTTMNFELDGEYPSIHFMADFNPPSTWTYNYMGTIVYLSKYSDPIPTV